MSLFPARVGLLSMTHPARIYLIDPSGRIREIYSLAFFDERQALLDIQAIEQEKLPPARH